MAHYLPFYSQVIKWPGQPESSGDSKVGLLFSNQRLQRITGTHRYPRSLHIGTANFVLLVQKQRSSVMMTLVKLLPGSR
jgi:hypothetical protein